MGGGGLRVGRYGVRGSGGIPGDGYPPPGPHHPMVQFGSLLNGQDHPLLLNGQDHLVTDEWTSVRIFTPSPGVCSDIPRDGRTVG